MSAAVWWACGVGGYLAVGLLAVWLEWRFTKPFAGPTHQLGFLFLSMALWPIAVFGLVLKMWEVEVPSYDQWQARRREARERRESPSEVTPAGRAR